MHRDLCWTDKYHFAIRRSRWVSNLVAVACGTAAGTPAGDAGCHTPYRDQSEINKYFNIINKYTLIKLKGCDYVNLCVCT